MYGHKYPMLASAMVPAAVLDYAWIVFAILTVYFVAVAIRQLVTPGSAIKP